jgi:uncharacterized protein YndB with AHSA1/START domain
MEARKQQGQGTEAAWAPRRAGSFTTTITVDRPPEAVFAAVLDVRAWWSGRIEGKAAAVGDVFTYRYEDLHRSTQRVAELVPGRRVVWHVTDARLSFVEDQAEWAGTDLVFEIVPRGRQTELRFTHDGLLPTCQCFQACSGGWRFLVQESLRSLLTTGRGVPFKKAG